MLKIRLLMVAVLLLLSGVAAAETYQIADVIISGNERVPTASIRTVLKISPGQVVTADEIDQAVQDIFALGLFDNITADITDVAGAKFLAFFVSERPLVREVKLAGFDEISEEDLRELITVEVPGLYDPRQVKQTLEAFRQAYDEEGYRAAKFEPVLDVDDNNEATLTFKIEEGENILVGSIRFEGNRVFSESELRDVIETRPRWWLSWLTGRGTFNEAMAGNDVQLLIQHYHDNGYMDVQVLQPQVALSEDSKSLDVSFEIVEGSQYRVGSINITGEMIKKKSELMELVSMETDEVFSRSKLRSSLLAINDLYADNGFAYVNVAPLTRKNREELIIDLTFDIEKGPLVNIDRIRISGNNRTRDKVIRRQLKLAEGDQYSASKIRESRGALRNLGFFESVNIRDSESSDPSLANLDVEVVEQPTGSFTLGAGYSTVDGLIGQGSISQNNFNGYGIKLDAAASIGGASTTYRLGITDPYFLDSQWTVGFDVYKREQDWSDFSEKTTGGALRGGYPLTKYAKGLVTYRYEEKEIYDVTSESLIILDQEGTSKLSSLTFAINRNSTDYYQDPSTGGVSKYTFEYAGLGGTERFGKLVGSHRHFWPVVLGTVVSLHGQIGYVFETSDKEIPIDEKFFLGGLRSIRGFETREVGPQDPETGDYIGGEKSAFFNLEYLFPISKSLGVKGVLFFDTGNAWKESENYFEDMRYSAGAGIRWFSPLGPLRFEWGYNLDREPGEKKSVFEFSMGTAF